MFIFPVFERKYPFLDISSANQNSLFKLKLEFEYVEFNADFHFV